MSLQVAALFALVASAVGVTVPGVRYTNGWEAVKVSHRAGTTVSFTVVVKEQGRDEIKRIAKEVSDPSNPKYGEFLTTSQIKAITRPSDEDMSAVLTWLNNAGVEYKVRGVSNIDVTASVRVAEKLLATEFHMAKHTADGYALLRAGDYAIPDAVYPSIATIFGLHGLPLPKQQAVKAADPGMPVDVTPSVIYETYKVTKQEVRRSPDNRQAVAEFQGQFMNSTDLVNMFKRYVTGYEEGVDDKVTVWHGEHIENSGGIEAELDIQYIMGVSPGIQTEFWEFPGQDFGGDLNMWTSNLTTGDDVPLVHSVSYGWQGNLSQIGVKMSDVTVVDDNFAKLAAKGISIMISSGDSGSGYAQSDPCEGMPEQGQKLEGTVIGTKTTEGYSECCEWASQQGRTAGWTFKPDTLQGPTKSQCLSTMTSLCGPVAHGPGCQKCIHDHHDALFPVCHGTGSGQEFCGPAVTNTAVVEEDEETDAPAPSIKFKKTEYHVEVMNPQKPVFGNRDLFDLTGTVTADGGIVKATCLNRTADSTEITFSAAFQPKGMPPQIHFYNVTAKFGAITLTGRAEAVAFDPSHTEVAVIEWFCPKSTMEMCYQWQQGPNPPPPPPPPPPGTCTAYSDISGSSSEPGAESGKAPTAKVILWASWPASSPWVTSVGATRFEGQKVGNPEMATDQFGSGGGFYPLFTTDAGFQADAVKKYLSTVDPSTLPPKDSFDPTARATPDVAALGEGFQVIVNGAPESVGGTSASSPTFAGLVSLLNEARIKAGKKQMGYLNPFLYANADAFFDVTAGSNKIGRGGQPLPYGFNCSAGWDPATGLGTPLFDKLLKAAMAAPQE